ncbi:IS110 family transposase [bacterium]|nr:IS110 family transposase [bacterium]
MVKNIKYVGLDVHKNSIVISIADSGRENDPRYWGRIDNNTDQLDKVFRKLISDGSELSCVYEAGPCGYTIYRYLKGNGTDCAVIAPSKIPRQSGDRIKNDRRDSLTLARLHRAGELTPVYVPDQADEALRDLVRARDDAQKALRKSKQQLNAFLLRHNRSFTGKTMWSSACFNWLSDISMEHPAQQFTLQEYINTVEDNDKKVKRHTVQISELSKESRLYPLILALQTMRGVSLVVASTLAAELGDLKRFETPSQMMAYLGLVPSESSSGPKVKRGSITKTGNGHVRRVLVEAAQSYRLPARVSRAIRKRQEGVPEKISTIAWKAQVRLCNRYQQLAARGKNANLIKTAIAREIAGFSWAIAQEL